LRASQRRGGVNPQSRNRPRRTSDSSGSRPSKAYTPPYRSLRSSEGVSNNRPTSVASAYSTGQETTAPIIRATRDSSRIIHRELVASIVGSANFAVPFEFAMNPGISASFPWLATQAQAWETYRFNKLEFKYFTRTGSTTPGSILLVPDYDAADAAPVSEQVASSYEDVTEDVPWKDQCCTLRPSSLHSIGPKKFVRTGPLAANLDIKTYDAGNLFVATTDGTAVSWGKLWVEYDVTLYTPQLPPTGAPLLSAQHFPNALNPTPTSANILGTAAGTLSPSGGSLVSVLGSVLTFNQPGLFEIYYNVNGTAVTIIPPTLGGGNTFSTTFGFTGAGNARAGNTTINGIIFAVVNAVTGGTVTFNNTITAGTSAELLVSQLPPLLV